MILFQLSASEYNTVSCPETKLSHHWSFQNTIKSW